MSTIIQQKTQEMIEEFLKSTKEIFSAGETLGDMVVKIHELTDKLGLDLPNTQVYIYMTVLTQNYCININ